MKIAISGKGGSGKTTISGTLARTLADRGLDVLAIDDDDNPNLALTLGVEPGQRVPPVPAGLLERVEGTDGTVRLELTEGPREIAAEHATEAPGGVKLLKMGEVDAPDQGCFCGAHATASKILGTREEDEDEVTVVDMVAGVEHLSRGTARDVDVMFVVVEPFYKSLETGLRTRKLAEDLGIPDVRVVANKVHDEADEEAIEEFCERHDLTIEATVPFDKAIRRADQSGQAPIDAAPDSDGVQAIRRLAGRVAPARA